MSALNHSQAVIHFDMNGNILYANANFLGAMGYTMDEIKGRHHRIFVDPYEADSPEYKAFWDTLRTGKFQSANYKRFAKGGRVVYIEASYNPICDGNGKPYMVVKFATDVTTKTLKMKEALDRQQAVISFKLDGTILEANENFLNAMNYSLDEIRGQHHRMFVDPDYAKTAEYRDFWTALGRGEYQAGEYKRYGRGGKEIWIRASYNPVYGNDGKPYMVTKYATDITEEKVGRVKRMGDLVNSVTTATKELSDSITDITRNISTTRDSVVTVGENTDSATQSMQRMEQVASGMTGITEIIDKISGQINLLALNAAIEAARAGDAGRGFSVVADEVKKLAQQVNESTGQISGEIHNLQTSSKDVSEALVKIKGLINDLLQNANSVASATEEQSAVTQNISHNMLQVRDLLMGNSAG